MGKIPELPGVVPPGLQSPPASTLLIGTILKMTGNFKIQAKVLNIKASNSEHVNGYCDDLSAGKLQGL